MPRLRLALAAEEAAGVQVLRQLAASGHDLVVVFTSEPSTSEPPRGATVFQLAEKLGYPTIDATRLTDASTAARLRAEQIDLLLNVHSLHVAHAAVIASPRLGSFNLHPGPLPEYAGLNCPSWAIWNEASDYGVTVHRMEPGIDTGAIAYQRRWELSQQETGFSLSARCVREGVLLIQRLVETAASGAPVPALPQTLSQRHLYRRSDRPHGLRLDLNGPATRAERMIRAACFHPLPSPWGIPSLEASDGPATRRIGIVKGRATTGPAAEPGTVAGIEQELAIAFGTGWLVPELLHVDGTLVEPADLLRGVTSLIGRK